MEAIVLAGGFGTRLQSVVSDVAKPMAKICGKPFVAYLIEYLSRFNVTRVVLCVGYKKESIQDYFQANYKGIEIVYSVEERALGTGGAIKKALPMVEAKKVFVCNGDTFFDVDLNAFLHAMRDTKIALALKPMQNFQRYGSVVVEAGRVVSFKEKEFTKQGLINGGIYLLQRDVFQDITEEIFSFEIFLQVQKNIGGFVSDGYFIDIGIPEDYKKAQKDCKEMF